MGRRSINTTKSGKYMNPTDQARKEARKRELKKNKKQRMAVRQAVLKGKDPTKLLTEMEVIDKMEYNPVDAPKLNEKVLKDKRKKLKETFQRVLRLYDRENPEYAVELKKAEKEYDQKRTKLQVYFEQVKNAERVQLDQIPLPDVPVDSTAPALIPLPNEIPLPSELSDMPGIKSILKHSSAYDPGDDLVIDTTILPKRKPPGPPPGTPPLLSDSEDEEYDPAKDIIENIGVVDIDVEHPLDDPHHDDDPLTDLLDELPPEKRRKIRFADSDEERERKGKKPEKDTRLTVKKMRLKAGITPLQAKMLRLAGQDVPEEEDEEDEMESDDDDFDPPDEKDAESPPESDVEEETFAEHKDDDRDIEDEEEIVLPKRGVRPGPPPGAPRGAPRGAPPGVHPPGVPPGPPPGIPPLMMVRPPPMRGGPPRLMPPGPPPGRPQGMPPGPPPGLPPNMRMPHRIQGPPGVLPPRPIRPHGVPPSSLPPPPGIMPLNPSVLSAPPNIMKLPQLSEEDKKTAATIEAKPQIKNVMGDVTRFTPTALKVKRATKDGKGKNKSTKEENRRPISGVPLPRTQAPVPGKTKDDMYDQFMREMEGLL